MWNMPTFEIPGTVIKMFDDALTQVLQLVQVLTERA